MTQYTTVAVTIDAEQFMNNVPYLVDWGAPIRTNPSGLVWLADANGMQQTLKAGMWVVRSAAGFYVMSDDEFRHMYVEKNPADTQSVTFRMKTVDGAEVRATIDGWVHGKDAVRALMHVGRPQTVLEFIKEQTAAGDMSMLTMVDELAALANPGE